MSHGTGDTKGDSEAGGPPARAGSAWRLPGAGHGLHHAQQPGARPAPQSSPYPRRGPTAGHQPTPSQHSLLSSQLGKLRSEQRRSCWQPHQLAVSRVTKTIVLGKYKKAKESLNLKT